MRPYALTIFLSAFLLFQVQPLIGKIILPWFGGSAAVWSAALLFFQVVLLFGYLYAHLLIRFLSGRAQMNLHVALLITSCALLPILPSPSWRMPVVGDPTLRILLTLGSSVGLPYFLLSATGPLLQTWYVQRSGSAVPYRLFALSNAGSLLALLSFPFLVEPLLASPAQAYLWSGGYGCFALLCTITVWSSRGATIPSSIRATHDAATTPSPAPGASALAFQALLAACASVLLISVTNHIARNVAPIPFLWILPLSIYLLTFILAFESDRFYRRRLFLPLLPIALGGMLYLFYVPVDEVDLRWVIAAFAAGLFVCCMVCHGELARRRPAPEHLTHFYLMVSLGGALGGIFVALIAPQIFSSYSELPLGLVLCAALGVIAAWRSTSGGRVWVLRTAGVTGVVLLGAYAIDHERRSAQGAVFQARNFYGTLRVVDDAPAERFGVRRLLNGTVEHGAQLLDTAFKTTTSYYGEFSGVGRALRARKAKGAVRVGVIGLGAGVLAQYGRSGDHFTFYEIDPLSAEIARSLFTFTARSPAQQSIILGDARLALDAQDAQRYDLLVVDAFSGDAIPVHLLTHEAMGTYMRHLAPDGILAFHISNHYLDLEPVCAANASAFGRVAMVIDDDVCTAPWYSPSIWVLIAADTTIYQGPAFRVTVMATPDAGTDRPPDFAAGKPRPARIPEGFRPWTDAYSNLFQVMAFDR